MMIRILMINGDSRQGRYVRHDDKHVFINDGRERKIQLLMIADVTDVPQYESCLSDPCPIPQDDDRELDEICGPFGSLFAR